MIQGLPSQTGQLRDVLDYAPIAVFVCALKNGKLLYANQAARALLPSREGLEAYTCYQMAGFDRPCPFCQAEKMNRTELLVREFVHPQSRRIFQLSGKLIDWVGEPAHIEYIVDITEIRHKDERAKALREELEATLGNIPSGLAFIALTQTGSRHFITTPPFMRSWAIRENTFERLKRRPIIWAFTRRTCRHCRTK